MGSQAATLPLAEFLDLASTWLEGQGFHRGEALAVTASCRDEIVAEFRAAVRAHWDNAFDFSSLSALPLAGATGMRAVLDHVPEVAHRPQVVVFAMPHVGVLADGSYGQVMRHGRVRPTSACGSLIAAASWAADAADDPLAAESPIDPLDAEQSLVRQRLLRADARFFQRDPLALATWVAGLILEDVWDLVEALSTPEAVDVAVVTGVLINGSLSDSVLPSTIRMRRAGSVVDVELAQRPTG